MYTDSTKDLCFLPYGCTWRNGTSDGKLNAFTPWGEIIRRYVEVGPDEHEAILNCLCGGFYFYICLLVAITWCLDP